LPNNLVVGKSSLHARNINQEACIFNLFYPLQWSCFDYALVKNF